MLLGMLALVVGPVRAGVAPGEGSAAEATLKTQAKLEVLKRLLPDQAETASGLESLERLFARAGMAAGLRMSAWSAHPDPAQDLGGQAFVPLTFEGTFEPPAGFRPPDEESAGFLVRTVVDALGRGSRVVLFDRVELAATPEGALRVSGSARLHYTPSSAAQGPEERLQAKVLLIESLRARSAWPLARLAALAETGKLAVFTRARLEPARIAVQGLSPWPYTAPGSYLRALEPSRFDWVRRGSCQEFDWEGAVKGEDGPPAEQPPREDGRLRFGRPGEGYCWRAPEPTRRLARVELAGKGPLSLKARDLDLAQVAWLLHKEAGEAVIVDGSVQGAVDVDFSNVTLEEAMTALRGYGALVTRAGRVRVVSAMALGELPQRAGTEFPVSFSLTAAPFSWMLHLLQDVSGDKVLLAAPDPPAVAVYAPELPFDELYGVLFAVTGLVERREGGLRSGEAVPPAALRDRALWPPGRKEDVPADEFDLVAVSTSKGTRTAWIRTPRGGLLDYRAADRCWDGVVKSVDAEQVTIRVDVTDPLSPVRFREREVSLPAAR